LGGLRDRITSLGEKGVEQRGSRFNRKEESVWEKEKIHFEALAVSLGKQGGVLL